VPSLHGTHRPVAALHKAVGFQGQTCRVGHLMRKRAVDPQLTLVPQLQRADGQSAPGGLLPEGSIRALELLHWIFSALAQGSPAPEPDLASLNKALAAAPARTAIVRPREQGYAWQLPPPATLSAPVLLDPVLWSAGDLLVQGDLSRVRQRASVAVPRRGQERLAALVRHELVRKPRQALSQV
jgi:hypothetical protein